MDTRITKPSHRWLKALSVHRTALPIRFEVSGASNEGREPETRYRMACAAIAAHQRCCLPGSLKTTDEGLKKKLAWLPFAGKNRGWENFSVPASRVFCAVRRLATRPQGQVLARAQKDAALPAHRLAVQATAAEPEQARRLSLVRLACGGGACALWMGQAHYKTPRLGPRLGPRFGFGPSLGEALVAKALAQGFTKASPGHPLVMPRWPWWRLGRALVDPW